MKAAKEKNCWLLSIVLACVFALPSIASASSDVSAKTRAEIFLLGRQNGTGQNTFEPAKRVEFGPELRTTALGSPVAPKGAASFADGKERAIAEYLEQFGRKTSKNPLEGVAGAGRQGDAFVDGVLHEFKTLDPGAASNTIKNVVNNSIKGGGQARNIVIDARGSGLSQAEALRGLGRAAGISRGKLDNITIIGDDFFINRGIVGQ